VIMLAVTCWAMIENTMLFYNAKNWLLVIIGSIVFILSLWMAAETANIFFKKKT
jgi:hypothetical protein